MSEITKEEMRRCFEEQNCSNCQKLLDTAECSTARAVIDLIESSGSGSRRNIKEET